MYRYHLQGSRAGPLKMGTIRCPKTSVMSYHHTLRNIPEQRSSGLLWFRMRSKKRHETSRSINDIARLSVILFPNNSAHVNCLINKFGQYYTIILLLRATALTDTTLTNTIIYNKPTRCNSGSIVFINNYKYALHVSDAPCVHHQEHYKL